MSTLGGKKYGLILPSKKVNVTKRLAKPSVFGDSSSDEEDGRGHVNISLRLENEKKSKQTHETVAKALVEDPNVFEYDSLYDDMVAQKRKADPRLQKKDTKPKYIAALKRATERRKIEQDIIYERKVQLEMEREGKDYRDEEAFLTSAYQKKLEERKRMEEELKEEAQREKANDITKQKDLSRFYQHLLNQRESTTATDEKPKSPSFVSRSRRRSGESKQEEETAAMDTNRQLDERTLEHHKKELSPQESEKLEAELEHSKSQDNGDVQIPTDVAVGTAVEVDIEERRQISTDVAGGTTVEVDIEERRRIASAKRTDSQAFKSARERYLARKKAKLATASSSSP